MDKIFEILYLFTKFMLFCYLFFSSYLHSAKMPGEELVLH